MGGFNIYCCGTCKFSKYSGKIYDYVGYTENAYSEEILDLKTELANLNEYDRKIISMLYQPIMGFVATSLYYTLWADLDKTELLKTFFKV